MTSRTILAVSAIALQAASGIALAADIEEIVVQGQRLEETIPLDLSRYGNQVEVITGEQIQQGGFVDITQTLQMMVPGLHVAPKNGPFDYFSASLQGSRNDDILWLIDGVRITNRLYNSTSPLDTIPAHVVERIEVLKGGQGIFYGTQSVAGVVNIVTKGLQKESDGEFSSAVNSNDGYSVNGYWRGGSEQHQFLVFASRDEAEGYTPYRKAQMQPSATDRDRGYDVNSLGFKYGWSISPDARLSLQYQFNDAELDFARPTLNNKTVNAREESIASLTYDYRLSENVEIFIKAYRHAWDTSYTRIYNELDANGRLTGGLIVRDDESFWGYEDYGINAMARFNYGHGLEYVLGFDRQTYSGEDEVWRIGKQEETINAPFVQIRTTEDLLENTLFALGVRNNRASSQGDSTVWNLTGKHNFNEYWYVQGNVGTTFRSADAEALFLSEFDDPDGDGVPDAGFSVGNPDLEPEEGENINVSLGGALAQNLAFELTYFTRDVSNYISSIETIIAGVPGTTYINSDDEVNIDGFELIGTAQLTSSLSGQLSFTETDARENSRGPQINGIPEREIKLSFSYAPAGAAYGLSLTNNYVSDINAPGGQVRDSYLLTDISGYYNFGASDQHEVVLRLENVTDEDYATGTGSATVDVGGASYYYETLGMPRTVHLSYTYRF